MLTIKRVVADTSNTNTITNIGSMGISQPTATVNLPTSFSATDPNGPVSLWIEVLLCSQNLDSPGYTKVTFYARGALSTNTALKVEVASAGAVADACSPPDSPCLTLSANGDAADDACTPAGFSPNPFTKPPERLTSSWQQYSIPVPNSQLANVRDFFKATFVFTDPFVGNQAPGQGGTIYVDQIQYEQ